MPLSVSVRLEGEEEACIELIRAYLQGRTGPGVRISDSDSIRYALHVAANLAATEMADQGNEEATVNGK